MKTTTTARFRGIIGKAVSNSKNWARSQSKRRHLYKRPIRSSHAHTHTHTHIYHSTTWCFCQHTNKHIHNIKQEWLASRCTQHSILWQLEIHTSTKTPRLTQTAAAAFVARRFKGWSKVNQRPRKSPCFRWQWWGDCAARRKSGRMASRGGWSCNNKRRNAIQQQRQKRHNRIALLL